MLTRSAFKALCEPIFEAEKHQSLALQVNGVPARHALQEGVLENARSGFIGNQTASLVFRVTNK